MASVMGPLEKVMPVPVDYTSEFLRTSAGVTNIGSNAKAKRELGYDPRPLEVGIAETMQYEMQLLGMCWIRPARRDPFGGPLECQLTKTRL